MTDLAITEGAAATLMTSRASLNALEAARLQPSPRLAACAQVEDVDVNQVFYRKEPHMKLRYSALAMDNIRRDPGGFLLASAYRAVRLFVIEGASDPHTAQQFTRSRVTYAAAWAASIGFLGLFGFGVAVAWRRGYDLAFPLLLVAYIPATLAPVLTNMRYTVTVQPLMFMFVAVALTSIARGRPGHVPPRLQPLARE